MRSGSVRYLRLRVIDSFMGESSWAYGFVSMLPNWGSPTGSLLGLNLTGREWPRCETIRIQRSQPIPAIVSNENRSRRSSRAPTLTRPRPNYRCNVVNTLNVQKTGKDFNPMLTDNWLCKLP